MNYKMMGRLFGLILCAESVFMIPSLILALTDAEMRVALGFGITMGLCALIGGVLLLLCRGAKTDFYAKEGLVCVGLSWILMCLFGALPFFIGDDIPSYVDAVFEIVSGFTTTGASICTNVEALSRATLYWRAFSHWVGGMGVLVFLMALVPVGGKSEGFTMHLLRAESPGPDVGKLVPRMRYTAMILYLVYVVLTVICFIFLVFDMPVFDAICTSFGTAGTGGFGIKNDSLTGYSPYVQTVTGIFMLLFGVNFSCYYLLLLRNVLGVLRDEELRFYFGIVGGAVLLITLNIRTLYATFGEALRHAFFQVSSIITTTGFATTDFDLWPSLSKAILLILMVVGACAGSTGGGLKCARALLLIKSFIRNIGRVQNPQKVAVIRVNKKPVDEKIVSGTMAYLCAYVLIVLVSFLLISIDNFSTVTNLSAVIACFNNIGPGLETVGPTGSYAGFSDFSKIVLTIDMLAGRLEIFPILALFSRKAWKRG
ncbi:MAG: TrkH family potassium uptake protein [Clostridia bacterium]|nr:TrkH family potassium uptake protein [Clostridia bacterium]